MKLREIILVPALLLGGGQKGKVVLPLYSNADSRPVFATCDKTPVIGDNIGETVFVHCTVVFRER